MKRLIDILVASVGMVLLSPFFVLIIVGIYFSDGRPIFFRQNRMGLNKKSFFLIKFRSMSVLEGAENGKFDAGDKARVTALGVLMRKYKLDELPQLWNVLRGDMSIVGPRPEIRKWVEAYPDHWDVVLTVRPGITDPASIRFRNEEELLAQASDPQEEYREVILPQKLALSREYVLNVSICGDIALIFKTIFVVFRK